MVVAGPDGKQIEINGGPPRHAITAENREIARGTRVGVAMLRERHVLKPQQHRCGAGQFW